MSETYRQHFERERWQLLDCSRRVRHRRDRPHSDEEEDVDASEMDVFVFVNTSGFTMLCGFSTKGLVRSSGLLFPTQKQSRRRCKAYIVQRLVDPSIRLRKRACGLASVCWMHSSNTLLPTASSHLYVRGGVQISTVTSGRIGDTE